MKFSVKVFAITGPVLFNGLTEATNQQHSLKIHKQPAKGFNAP